MYIYIYHVDIYLYIYIIYYVCIHLKKERQSINPRMSPGPDSPRNFWYLPPGAASTMKTMGKSWENHWKMVVSWDLMGFYSR